MGIADYFFFLLSVFPLWIEWSWGIPLTILNFCSFCNSIEIKFLAPRNSKGVLVPGRSQQVEAEFHWWLGNRATFSLHFPPHPATAFLGPHFVSNLRVPDSSIGSTWPRMPEMQSWRKENKFPVLIITKVTCFAFLFSFFFPLFLKVKVSWSILT